MTKEELLKHWLPSDAAVLKTYDVDNASVHIRVLVTRDRLQVQRAFAITSPFTDNIHWEMSVDVDTPIAGLTEDVINPRGGR